MDFEDNSGKRIPMTYVSEAKMRPDIPKAKKAMSRCGAMDLAPMIFGEEH